MSNTPQHFLASEPRCPKCGALADGAAPVDAARPQAPRHGDFSVCIVCMAWLRYENAAGGLTLRLARNDDLLELGPAGLKDLRDATDRIRTFNRSRN